MSFLDSINAGITRAREANASVEEVNAIFREISDDLKSIDNRVNIALRREEMNPSRWRPISAQDEFTSDDTVCLVIANESVVEKNEIARWEQSVKGYPCTLTFEGESFVCYNLEDLRAAFEELLGTVFFGKTLIDGISRLCPPYDDPTAEVKGF